MILLILAAAGLFGLLALLGFMRLERTGRSHIAVAIVLGIAGLEILLQGPHFLVPIGLFRLPIGPLDARPIDLVLPLALAARILGRPVSTRVSTTLVLWMAFAAWYVFGAYWGFVLGNDTARLINQVRAVLILVGVIALVAGVPARHYVSEIAQRRMAQIAVFLVPFIYFFRFTVGWISLNIPFASIPQFGAISSDASLAISIFGMYVVVTQLYREDRRWLYLGSGMLLVLVPLLGTQGASIIGMSALIAFMIAVSYSRHWRRNVHLTGTEVALFAVLLIGIGTIGQLVLGEELAIAEQVEESLFSQSQQRTSNVRVLLWSEAIDIALESPGLGVGVGFVQDLPDQWPEPPAVAASHNIFLDIALRSGAPGLILLTMALVSAAVIGVRSWAATDDAMGALALVAVGGLLAIVVKGQVESLLDQFRHAVMIGSYVGFIGSIARFSGRTSAMGPSDAEDTRAVPIG